MTTWHTATVRLACGACGHGIAAGAPYLTYRLAGVSRPLLRCRGCAGDPVAPVEAPPARPRLALPDWTPVAALVPSCPTLRHAPPGTHARLDARLAALRGTAAREPGEEG